MLAQVLDFVACHVWVNTVRDTPPQRSDMARHVPTIVGTYPDMTTLYICR